MENCKFLIAGDVKGNFEKLFKKVSSVHKKKGPFDFLLCVGSFFCKKDQQWEHYIKNGSDVPLIVYILGPNSEEEREFYPDDLNKLAEINSKIIYLGKRGQFTTCKRLKIGFLSGLEANDKANQEWNFGENDTKALLKVNSSIEGPLVDVFLSSVWPQGITLLDNAKLQPKNASNLLSSVVSDLRPWYHFAGWENVFYERAPYSNKNENGELTSVTRFIALGSVSSNEKWLHAISLDIPKKFSQPELQLLAGSMTPTPFSKAQVSDIQSYRFDLSSRDNKDKKRSKGKHGNKNKIVKIDAEKECWFCLSSGQAENHLIISVGKYTYLSLNRGGLVSQHLNIFPIEHIPSMSQASEAVLSDVETYRSLLKKYFKKLGFHVLFYERFFKTYHFQIHCVPLLPEMADHVENVFAEKLDGLENIVYEISATQNVIDLPPEQNYFHVIFPSGSNLVAKIDSYFPLNFGRTVMVDKRLMNAEEKEDWRNCVLSVEEETEIVNDLRKSIVY